MYINRYRYFATVCFRVLILSPKEAHSNIGKFANVKDGDNVELANNEINKRLLENINGSGKIYMTHAVIGGIYVIRFAVGASLTEECHVREAWRVIQNHADSFLPKLGY
jgi:aromatic-L-amino-acid/L-tryptophan decarboxylase